MDPTKKTRVGTPAPRPVSRSGNPRSSGGSSDAIPQQAGREFDSTGPTMAQFSTDPPVHTPVPRHGPSALPAATPAPEIQAAYAEHNLPAAGQAAYEPPPDPFIGKTINGRYQIHRKLGEGGMGSVYLAQHITLEKEVALKILHGEFARKPDLVQRFLQEAKAASRIRHENVIDITDFGVTPEHAVFFAMEVLEGRDLHDLVTRAKLEGNILPWERTRRIFLQICAALSAAHQKGIIHRDLKPENIYLVEWLGHKDFVKLLDFGIAKLTETSDQERKLTRTGMLFGTPEYMSPEQARGEPVDHRVDIYAMGCILHQLITGSVPFSADNFMGVLSLHLTEPPKPIPEDRLVAVGAPTALNAVFLRALAKDREQRFASIDDMVAALHALESGDQSATPEVAVAVPQAGGRTRTQWTGRVSMPDNDAGSGKPAPLPVSLPSSLEEKPRRRTGLWLALGVIAVLAIAGGGLFVTQGEKLGLIGPGTGDPGASESSPGVAAAPSLADDTRDRAGTDDLPGEGEIPAEPGSRTGSDDEDASEPGTESPAAATPDPEGGEAGHAPGQATLVLQTEPGGAEVLDERGSSLGKTPLSLTVAVSDETRRFRYVLAGYHDKVVELVPSHSQESSMPLTAVAAAEPRARETSRARQSRQRSEAGKKRSSKKRSSKKRSSKKPGKKPGKKSDDDGDTTPSLKNPFGK